jgi:hypothetical protein
VVRNPSSEYFQGHITARTKGSYQKVTHDPNFSDRPQKIYASCRFAAPPFDNLVQANSIEEDRHAFHQHFYTRT